jgi:phospholipid/cholesterol/gamma-HCH transport system substrate-binding protein
MEPRAHHLLIGIFTLVVALAAVSFALWLSKSHQHPQTAYIVQFNEAVRGLAKGSMVQYNGIKVGEVTDLALDPRNPATILVGVKIDSVTPVRTDTRARLMITGLTGQAVVELTGGSVNSPRLTSRDGTPPVIASVPSPFSTLFNNGDQLLANVASLAASGRAFLTPENAQAFAQTLQNIARLTNTMTSQTETLQHFLDNAVQVSQATRTTVEQAGQLMQTTRNMLSAQGTQTLQAMESALAALRRTSATLGQTVQENRSALGAGMQGLAELGPTLRELRATLSVVRSIAQQLDANPGGYLLGREKPKEFEP